MELKRDIEYYISDLESERDILEQHRDLVEDSEEKIEELEMAIMALKKRSRRGKWIDADSLGAGMNYKLVRCSCCGKGFGKALAEADFKFCPNCGQKMDVVIDWKVCKR